MGYVLHARARTTPAVRREIQSSQESLMTLAQRYDVNPKTICTRYKTQYRSSPVLLSTAATSRAVKAAEREGGERKEKKKFKPYPIDHFHVDIAEVQTEEGRLYLFVAIDRTSKFSYS